MSPQTATAYRETDHEAFLTQRKAKLPFDEMSDRAREATMHNWSLKVLKGFEAEIPHLRATFPNENEQTLFDILEDDLKTVSNRLKDLAVEATRVYATTSHSAHVAEAEAKRQARRRRVVINCT